jgi:hypothetical protein
MEELLFNLNYKKNMIKPIELYTKPKLEWGKTGDMSVRYRREITMLELAEKINEIIEVINIFAKKS